MKQILIIIFLIITSCQNHTNPTKEKTEKSEKSKLEKGPISKRVWLKYDYEKGYVLDEVYIFSNSDSLVNQTQVFKNQSLDTLKSHFYKLNLKRNNDSIVEVSLNYFSDLQLNNENNIASRKVTIHYTSESKNGMVNNYKEFKNVPLGNLTINFNLNSKKEPIINGYIQEELFLKDEKNKIIRGFTYIDNQSPQTNPYDIRKQLKD